MCRPTSETKRARSIYQTNKIDPCITNNGTVSMNDICNEE